MLAMTYWKMIMVEQRKLTERGREELHSLEVLT
jgi:hypothetical protein